MNIRKATISDLEDVYNWRNDKLSMSMSLNQEEISLASHTSWFENKIQDESSLLFIIEIEKQKAATVRFDKNKNSAEVSINLNPIFRGKGYASKILTISEIEMRKHWNAIKVVAKIKKDNIASTKIFEKCDFKLISSAEGILTYEK